MTKIIKRNNINIEQNLVEDLGKEFNLDNVLMEFLISRGFDTKEKIDSFLYDTLDNLSSPFLYTNMDKVVERLKIAQKENERIVVYGDYDCDGIGAIAIIYLACVSININVDYYIPTRAKEGYGLNCKAIKKIYEDFSPDILLTVDCGITANEEIEYAKQLGMEVIVSDHHKLGDVLPDCLVVNPCLDPDNTPLCGAGVAFKIIEGWLGKDIAIKYIDICAISTIADVVPLIKDNRIIAKYGMQAIKKGKCRKGIKELIFTANGDYRKISTYDMAFKIAPRLNASGRLNNADISLTLLIENDTTLISMLAKELEMLNAKRQELNKEIYKQAKIMLKDYDLGTNKIIVLYDEAWNEGVLGIVAARITEEFNRPTIMLTSKDNKLKGSSRSIIGIDIYKVLLSCQKYLLGFGGHAMAAGLQLEKKNLEKFIKYANQYLINNYKDEDFEKIIQYDFYMPISKFSNKFSKQLSLLEPYGCGNRKPLFYDDNYKNKFKQIGKTAHIKGTKRTGDLVLFGQYCNIDFYNNNTFKIIYTYSKKIFREREYNQFMPKAILPNLDTLPDDNELITYYMQTLLYSNYNNKKGNIPVKKNSDSPCLYITFDKNNFIEYTNAHPNMDKFLYINEYISGNDSIVLCPTKSFDFAYYNKVVVIERLSANYIEFLKGQVGKVEILGNKRPKFATNCTNIEILRNDYKFFKSILNNNYEYKSTKSFYDDCIKNGYDKEYHIFLSSFYIFLDVELILKNENDILNIRQHKVDIENSEVFKCLLNKDI